MEHHLSDKELDELYQSHVKPAHFDDVPPAGTQKVAIFLAGQPGAGKAKLTDHVKNTLVNNSGVVIDSDSLRKAHPKEPHVAETDVYSLDRDTFRLGDKLIADCIREGKHIIFDGTFGGNPVRLQEKMKLLKEAGYTIELCALSVNDAISKIGVQFRYELQYKEFHRGRPVDMHYHDEVYSRIPANLLTTLMTGFVDNFRIYGRDNHTSKTYLVKKYAREEIATNPKQAIVDYNNERVRALRDREVANLQSWYKETAHLTETNGHSVSKFKALIRSEDINTGPSLKNQLDEIIALNQDQIKQIKQLRKAIEESQKKIDELKGYTGELKRQAEPIEKNLINTIKSTETKIKLIAEGIPPEKNEHPQKKTINFKQRI